MISEKLIENHLERLPHRSAGYKQLLRELGLHGAERRELEEKLAAMVERGKLVLTDRDRYSLPAEAANRNLLVGRLTMHRDGYGFVVPESRELREQLGGDIFISPAELGSAMHGDQVLVELKGRPRRWTHRRPHSAHYPPRQCDRGWHLPSRPALSYRAAAG